MNLIGNLIVGLALLVSVVYAALALGPRTWRHALLHLLGVKSNAASSAGACGGCEGCAGGAAPPPPAAEIKVPLAKIGRR